jgi:signal transduction histidine kinase
MKMPATGTNALARAALLALLTALPAAGQRASDWRVYKMADGLPESACVSVSVTTQGKVLARHLNETWASELDGYSVLPVALPDGAIGRVYEGPSGQLWTVVPNGLQEFWDGHWKFHSVPEIAAEVRISASRAINPVPLCVVRQGVALCLLPDRLIEFNNADSDQARITVVMTAAETGLGRFNDLSQPRDREGGMWIAGANGLVRAPSPLRNLKPGGPWTVHIAPPEYQIQNFQAPHEDAESGVLMVAESAVSQQKVLVHFEGQRWDIVRAPSEKFRHFWQDTDGLVWASTINAIFHQDPASREFIEDEELSGRRLFDVAVEPGGAFWVATGDGLFRHAPALWRVPPALAAISGPVHSVTTDAGGVLWFVTSGGLHSLDMQTTLDFAFPTNWPRLAQPSRFLFPLKDGSLLFESGDQLARFHPASEHFEFLRASDSTDSFRPLGLLKDGNLCVQRPLRDATAGAVELASYDGRKLVPVPDPPPASMTAGVVSAVLETRNGDLWIAGDRGSAWCHDHHWQAFAASDHSAPEGIIQFAETAGGKLWCATMDKVWQFDGKVWTEARRGFDHINAITPGRDGSLWVASNNGVQRFSQSVWLENNVEEGFASPAIRAICEDSRGGIWAATSRGLCRFHPESDRDPPQSHLQVLSERERNVHEGETITLNFQALDKWKFTNRDRLQYSFYLDEREWSSYGESRTASFSDLPFGKHYFQVRAMDRAGNVDLQPARLDFAVVLPWYRESRLVIISFAGLIAVLFFAGLAVNRHLRLVRSYAEVEQIVTQRTRELERANRELLHSQKMNALGVLAAGIAHDFNNILSIIKGSAQIIEDNLEDAPKIRTRLDRIKTVVEQGSGIVRAMLGFSRDTGQELRPSDLNSVVDQTLKLLGDRFTREVTLQFESVPDLPPVRASSDFIQQILLNFIFNAAESMTSRKEIIITTGRSHTLPPGLVLRPGQGSEFVFVSVRDTGSGISPEVMPRIFEPFFTTKALSARRGTGLGLSMVYELARKIEAGICVESVPGQGSTFTLILVAVTASQPEPQFT